MPSEANRFAAARPMPLAPPVMTALRPSVKAGCTPTLLRSARYPPPLGEAVQVTFQCIVFTFTGFCSTAVSFGSCTIRSRATEGSNSARSAKEFV